MSEYITGSNSHAYTEDWLGIFFRMLLNSIYSLRVANTSSRLLPQFFFIYVHIFGRKDLSFSIKMF